MVTRGLQRRCMALILALQCIKTSRAFVLKQKSSHAFSLRSIATETSSIRERLQQYFEFPLDDWQLEAGVEILNGNNVIVCAPTGAGKTVVGEMALHMAVEGEYVRVWKLHNTSTLGTSFTHSNPLFI